MTPLISEMAFDILHTVDECVYIEICDIMCDNGLLVDHMTDGDLRVYIYFTDSWSTGCLIIDRYSKEFILEFKTNDATYTPIVGELEDVLKAYLGMRNEQ